MPTFDSQNIPPVPFRDSLSGPAGDYSAEYQDIVRQYREQVASAQALRDEQAGVTRLPPAPGLIHKSGNDIVRIDPQSGSANLIYRAPEPPAKLPPIPKPSNPYTSPYDVARIHAARTSYDSAQKAFDKATREMIANPTDQAAMQARELAMQDLTAAKADLNSTKPQGVPPINPPAVLAPPSTTATAPAYSPQSMLSPGEIPPPGSIVIGRKSVAPTSNTLDAPPSTTQSVEVIRTLKDGRKVVFDASTKKFLRYAQ